LEEKPRRSGWAGAGGGLNVCAAFPAFLPSAASFLFILQLYFVPLSSYFEKIIRCAVALDEERAAAAGEVAGVEVTGPTAAAAVGEVAGVEMRGQTEAGAAGEAAAEEVRARTAGEGAGVGGVRYSTDPARAYFAFPQVGHTWGASRQARHGLRQGRHFHWVQVVVFARYLSALLTWKHHCRPGWPRNPIKLSAVVV